VLSRKANVRGERRAQRVRSSALFGADPRDLSTRCARKSHEQLWDQGTEVYQAIGPSTQHDDGDGESREALLKRQVPIDGDERVELALCSRQEFTIGECRPPGLWNGCHVMSADVSGQAAVDALVQ
jgi:hypothetical protein